MYINELELFQRSNETIWTDEHINKSLLKAHLDESTDGASRKSETRTKIVNWINQKIEPNSKIIDLGCGPGLYSYELASLGHKIMGIDFNKASYNYANDNKTIRGLIEYKYGNYLKDKIIGKYNIAMMIYCDFGALVPNEQIFLLKMLKNILKDDGIWIFDIFGISVMEKIQGKRYWNISEGNDFWSIKPYFSLEETKVFKTNNAIGTRYYLVDQKTGKIKEYILWDQYYDENSIQKLMFENGFEIIEINKNLVKNKEETLFIKAKKKS
jgi:SAM-dependent methyltransferase